MSKGPEECQKMFNETCGFDPKDQTIFFLNAYWGEYFSDFDKLSPEEVKNVYDNTEKLLRKNKLDPREISSIPQVERVWITYKFFLELVKKNSKGNTDSLDENPLSHRLFELMGEPLTILQFRKAFREIDQNYDGRMSMIEYLVYKYNAGLKQPKTFINELMNKPQGTNPELQKAQEALNEVKKEIEHIEEKKAEYQKKIESGGKGAERAQKNLDDFKRQEMEIEKLDKREAELKDIMANGSGVKKIRAKQELHILEARNDVGLLFALRKVLKKAEAAVAAAAKGEATDSKGSVWFLERQLEESKRYSPNK